MTKEEYILKHGEEAYKEQLERNREYREKNKERAKEYRERNRERIRVYQKEYQEKNKDKINERRREYYRTGKGRLLTLASPYNVKDRKKGLNISNNVTGAWIARYIIGNRCIYCGDDNIEHLGLDRIDNAKPHTEDNVVCSCFLCNSARGNRYTVDEFIEIMKDKRKT